MSLKPWREWITPHKDVLEGSFQESEFAADLTKVALGKARPEYQDPALFFERTYITDGMGRLLDSVVRRLAGRGGDPVVQLQTAFGGGKTHAMLAVYHVARGEVAAKELREVPSILDRAGIGELPRARVAVIDGNAPGLAQPRQRGSVTVNTLWGEVAWQLGGDTGYAMVAEADQTGTSPGKEILAELFARFAPCVVLMDEMVAYLRQFEEGKSYCGGSYGSNMSFLQALTEAVGQVPTACVLASLPESDLEAGGDRGRQALREIQHLFHRLEAVWKPVAVEEGFEIVRRRLFSPVADEAGRDAVCQAFADLYRQGETFPGPCREAAYRDRLRSAYPFHPELFDRLYEDWASLEDFQRTRGVLRLLAMVVHRLWSDGNRDLMILPASLPLYDTEVSGELTRYLPVGWEPVVDRDVDGPRAATTRIDETNERLGAVEAARRVARAIFLGSAPSTSGQRVRGIGVEAIRLGCVQPGQEVGRFDDALHRLADRLHYLYAGNERYWYDTQTNLRREAEERMGRFKRDEHLLPEIGVRVKALVKGRPFGGVHCFTPHADIPDDVGLRLVILPPTVPHRWKDAQSRAIGAAAEIRAHRGEQPRLNQNRLIYLAADEDATATVWDQTKRWLAWKSIVDSQDALNLDKHRVKEAKKNQEEAMRRLVGAVSEAYRWVLAPLEEPDTRAGKGGKLRLQWEAQRISESEGNRMEAIVRTLAENEMLIAEWSPFHLKGVLERWYWKGERRDYPLLTLWDDFCRYPYLPRLVDTTVLQNTVAAGIESRDFFAYAAGKEGERYAGLLFGRTGAVYLDTESLIVHPEAAVAQEERERAEAAAAARDDDAPDGEAERRESEAAHAGETPAGPGERATATRPRHFRRFHGSVELNPVSAAIDFTRIAEEVIQHFSSKLGTDVTLTLEVAAESKEGFDDATRRTVQENSRTLGFGHAEFEEE